MCPLGAEYGSYGNDYNLSIMGHFLPQDITKKLIL